MNSRRAWVVWSVGVFAYLIAVMQRTTFGVVGLEATDRFGATAAVLASFTVVQLVVYAGLQIPVGMLVDRYGPRLMITGGALLMTIGQTTLAWADSVPEGLLGRLLVGAGDATTFVSVMRLVPAWFGGSRTPMLTQLTGITGQLGQILSVVPFLALLRIAGWTPAFLSAAALGVLAFVLALTLIRNQPGPAPVRAGATTIRQTGLSLVEVWKRPGTRLGFWTHFTSQFSGTVFVLTWGYPFLVSGQQLTVGQASALMTLFVLAGAVFAPMFGRFVGRHPFRRSSLVLLVVAATILIWSVVLLYPGRAPLWLLMVLVVVLSIGGPGAMIGFDFARTYNPQHRIGTATGIVNVGGFVAALCTMYAVGVVLDILDHQGFSGGNLYSLDSFRIALSVQILVLLGGGYFILRTRRQVRAMMAAAGTVVPPFREAMAREIRRRQASRRSAG